MKNTDLLVKTVTFNLLNVVMTSVCVGLVIWRRELRIFFLGVLLDLHSCNSERWSRRWSQTRTVYCYCLKREESIQNLFNIL